MEAAILILSYSDAIVVDALPRELSMFLQETIEIYLDHIDWNVYIPSSYNGKL